MYASKQVQKQLTSTPHPGNRKERRGRLLQRVPFSRTSHLGYDLTEIRSAQLGKHSVRVRVKQYIFEISPENSRFRLLRERHVLVHPRGMHPVCEVLHTSSAFRCKQRNELPPFRDRAE